MGAAVAAAVTVGFVLFATVLSLAAYHSGVNIFAWSQQRAMQDLGYVWVPIEPRYQREESYTKGSAPGLREELQIVKRSKADGLWYPMYSEQLPGTADDWDEWVSDIGFDNPIAAHAYAEVQGWRAQ